MNIVKASMVLTVLNEEVSIDSLISDIFKMETLPEEVIIIDGGSKDDTIKKINNFIKRGYPIQLIIKNDISIARGRNLGIEKAKNNLIAITDGGCRVDRFWLKKIVDPLLNNNKIDVVGGWWKPLITNKFEKYSAVLTMPDIKEIDPFNFRPATRSMAFIKTAWEKVGRFPEFLDKAGEDTYFSTSLKKRGMKIFFEKNALIFWQPRSTIKSLFMQSYYYAKGDKQSGILKQFYYNQIFKFTLRFFLPLFIIFLAIIIHPLFLILDLILFVFFYYKSKLAKKAKDNNLHNILSFFILYLLLCIIEFGRICGYYLNIKKNETTIS